MADIKNSKSLLAKLLASENITVSHQNTQTAYFDLKNRTLVCPVWKDMDGDLYDLLMGHEVGHALETPEQGWHNAVKDGDTKFKGFLNVIEDARIERKIKSRFPGLGRSFSTAYKGLWERDFFGIKNLDIGDMTLIDRINIRFKLGAHVHVPFNDEERAMVAEVETAETWEDVEALARRVYGYTKENEQDKIQSMEDLKDALKNLANQDSSDEEDGDETENTDSDEQNFGGGYERDDDYDDLDDEAGDESSSGNDDGEDTDIDGGDEESEDSDEEGGFGSKGGLNNGEEKSNDPESVTDTNFRNREAELVNEGGIISMFELPEADLSKIVIANKIVMDDLEAWLRVQTQTSTIYSKHNIDYDKVVEKCVRKFTRNNNKFVMHLVKEFEMRKKASQYARQQTAKTGELDMNVLHKYKFSSDLFKKVTIVPRGKNHGMILFMDMSGSMQTILRNTLEQLLVLVSFCKTVRIPFDVYGFSDDFYNSSDRTTTQNIGLTNSNKFDCKGDNVCKIVGHSFHLKHLIGSSLSPIAMRRAFNTLCVVANEYSGGYTFQKDCGYFDRSWDASGFGLNGTPFVHTLLASREIIKSFRAAHKLDVTNVVYLTDGEGGDGLSCPNHTGMYSSRHNKLGVVYLIDKKTKKKVRINDDWNQQAAVTSLVRDVTGCKHIGFYLAESRSMKWIIRDIKGDAVKRSAVLKQLREDKFFAMPNLGYDNYFYIEAAQEQITEDGIGDLTGLSKAKITSAFKKSMNSKKSSRALVSQFAKEIAAGGLVA